tara:strand:- start:6247 stop:7395 length:1149 start_codon:yes stop_codon:yes gene_type:complete
MKKLAQKYRICRKTVMDTSDPGITFDDDGISNHYWEYHNFIKQNWYQGDDGRRKLSSMIEKIQKSGKGKDFDCILGLSGGLDSSYMLHKVVTEYNLRPLVFHVDGGWDTEIAVNNINCLVDKLSLDLYTEVIDWEEMRDFQLAMFKSGVPHLDVPQDMAFISVLYKFAKKEGIKYILNGGNISTESVLMPLEILYWPSDMRQVKSILSKFGTVRMNSYPFTNIYYHKLYLPYIKKLKVFKPLNYIPYKQKDAVNELIVNYGWKPYSQKHFDSRFTRFFEGYWLPNRFGYDMRRNQFSSLILSGQMTRELALEKLKMPSLSKEEVKEEFIYMSDKLHITLEELKFYEKMDKKYYWDYPNSRFIFKIGEKFLSKFAKTRRGGAY